LEALQLLKDGTSFATVAEKYSEDKAKQGGSLGWLALFKVCKLKGFGFL
jgi:parvulin-like peptidyl-prolyl isomerase